MNLGSSRAEGKLAHVYRTYDTRAKGLGSESVEIPSSRVSTNVSNGGIAIGFLKKGPSAPFFANQCKKREIGGACQSTTTTGRDQATAEHMQYYWDFRLRLGRERSGRIDDGGSNVSVVVPRCDGRNPSLLPKHG